MKQLINQSFVLFGLLDVQLLTITQRNDYVLVLFQLVTQERRLSTNASRTMAAMSLGFIVLVTPWTIQEVVAACTGTRAPAALDFLATWLALSNSFWNPFLYWLLNNHFRRISRELLFSRVSNRRFDNFPVVSNTITVACVSFLLPNSNVRYIYRAISFGIVSKSSGRTSERASRHGYFLLFRLGYLSRPH